MSATKSPNSESPTAQRQSFFFMFFGKSISQIKEDSNTAQQIPLKVKFSIYKGTQVLNTMRDTHSLTLRQGWSKLQKIELAFLMKDSNVHQNTDFNIQMVQIQSQNEENMSQVQIRSQKYTQLLHEGVNKVQQYTNFGNYRVKFLIFTDKSRHNLQKIVKAYRTSQQFASLTKENDNSKVEPLSNIVQQPQLFEIENNNKIQLIKNEQETPIQCQSQSKDEKNGSQKKVAQNIPKLEQKQENFNIQTDEVSAVIVHDRNQSLSDVAQVLQDKQQKAAEPEQASEKKIFEYDEQNDPLNKSFDGLEMGEIGQNKEIKLKEKPSLGYSQILDEQAVEGNLEKLIKEDEEIQQKKKIEKKISGMMGSSYFDRKPQYYEPLKVAQEQEYDIPKKKQPKTQIQSRLPWQYQQQQAIMNANAIKTESVTEQNTNYQNDVSEVVQTVDATNIDKKIKENKQLASTSSSDFKLTIKIILFILLLGAGFFIVLRQFGVPDDEEIDNKHKPKSSGKSKHGNKKVK